jgi:serine/threonine protein kinase
MTRDSGRQNPDFPRPFGKYELVDRLAVGGMAEIYLAKTTGIGGFENILVIKRLHDNLSEDDDFIEMMIDEAKIAVRLKHPNIAKIFDLGRIDAQYYIAMEYIEGPDVSGLLEAASEHGEQLPIPAVLFLGTECCSGLHYAHTRHDAEGRPMRIVHRDVSPPNIMLSVEGEVKIVDFGVAKARKRMQETRHGIVKGKFQYMAPEQAEAGKVDGRTDVFSMGIVLYEMITGHNPYDQYPKEELVQEVRRADIPPLRQHRPKLDPELDDIIMRSLRREPGDRYPSAAEFERALDDYMDRKCEPYTRRKLAQLVRRYWRSQAGSQPAGSGEQTAAGAGGGVDREPMSPSDYQAAESSLLYDTGNERPTSPADGGGRDNPFDENQATQVWDGNSGGGANEQATRDISPPDELRESAQQLGSQNAPPSGGRGPGAPEEDDEGRGPAGDRGQNEQRPSAPSGGAGAGEQGPSGAPAGRNTIDPWDSAPSGGDASAGQGASGAPSGRNSGGQQQLQASGGGASGGPGRQQPDASSHDGGGDPFQEGDLPPQPDAEEIVAPEPDEPGGASENSRATAGGGEGPKAARAPDSEATERKFHGAELLGDASRWLADAGIPRPVQKYVVVAFGVTLFLGAALGTFALWSSGGGAGPAETIEKETKGASAASDGRDGDPEQVDVSVRSDPVGVSVKVDGDPRGETPMVLGGLEAGRDYELTFEKDRYRTRAEEYTPEPEPDPLSVELLEAEGIVQVTTEPSKSSIEINSEEVGESPATVERLRRDREHTVRALRDDEGRSTIVTWSEGDDDIKEVSLDFETDEEKQEADDQRDRTRRTQRPRQQRDRRNSRDRSASPGPTNSSSDDEDSETKTEDLFAGGSSPDRGGGESQGDSEAGGTERGTQDESSSSGNDSSAADENPKDLDIWGMGERGKSKSEGGSEPGGKGKLSVQVRGGWGKVYVDGEMVASETPLVEHELAAGSYTVKVYYPVLKRYSEERTVEVKAGETTRSIFEP